MAPAPKQHVRRASEKRAWTLAAWAFAGLRHTTVAESTRHDVKQNMACGVSAYPIDSRASLLEVQSFANKRVDKSGRVVAASTSLCFHLGQEITIDAN